MPLDMYLNAPYVGGEGGSEMLPIVDVLCKVVWGDGWFEVQTRDEKLTARRKLWNRYG